MPAFDDRFVPISRRRFLGLVAVGGAGAWLLGCGKEGATEIATGPKGLILGASRQVNRDGRSRHWLGFVDLDTPEPTTRRMALPFFAHGMVPHPVHRERLALFEKRGRGACEVDLARGAVRRMIETLDHREFYGHGAFSPDGKLCYATESDIEDDYVGVVAIRDAETMKIVGEFPTFGSAPHDCHLIDGGRRMVITNGGDRWGGAAAPSVTIIDVARQELIERIEFDTPRLNAGHVAIATDDSLAIVSAPREGMPDLEKEPGAVTLRPSGGKLITMREPADVAAKMLSETLSVAIDERRHLVGATNPAGDIVTFWDLDRCRHLGSLELENARGIVLTEDGNEFVVSYGKDDGFVVRISTETLKPVAAARPVPTVIGGSHLINYRFDA